MRYAPAPEGWVDQVVSDPRTTERHYAAARALSTTDVAPAEHVQAADELVQLGHAFLNEDGRYTGLIKP